MFEWMLVYGSPIIGGMISGALFGWYCGWLGKSRFRHKSLSMLGCAIVWPLISNFFDFIPRETFGIFLLTQLLWVVLRMIVAPIFYILEKDKLIYVSVFYSLVLGIMRFTTRQMLGVSYLQIPWMDICLKLSPNGTVFFFLNKAVIILQFLLSDIIVALLVLLYGKMVKKALGDKLHPFSKSELLFLLLPSVASWLEISNISFMVHRQVPTTGTYATDNFFDYSNTAFEMMSMFVMLVLLIMSTINIVVYQRLRNTLDAQVEHKVLLRQNADMRRHLDEVTQLNENIRSVKHDMKNHIAVLERLTADVEGHEELKDYLKELGGSVQGMDARFSTGSVVVDALLDGKDLEAQKRLGGDFHIMAEQFLFPKDLKIHEYDIAVILGNALDNAIEGCEKQPKDETYITLSSTLRGNMFLMEVKNSFSGSIRTARTSDYPQTDKADAAEHGIGFSNMKLIAEKYYGAVDWRAEDDSFLLTVALQNTKPRE